MTHDGDNSGLDIRTVRLRLGGGWSGRVVLRGPDGSELTESDWRACLANPESLLDDVSDTLKSDGSNAVVVRQLNIGGRAFSVVVKSQRPGVRRRRVLRSLMPTAESRNLRMAMRLHSAGISVSYPMAALRKKQGLRTTHSIFVSEYVSDSCNLYKFLMKGSEGLGRYALQGRQQLAGQIGHLFGRLANEGLWHRDAKASNFLVQWRPGESSDGCEVFLVDMDGIKPYFGRGRRRQLRTLAKLASTVLCHGVINRTDYLRAFKAYSKMLGLDRSRARHFFREISDMATATRLLTMANSAIEGRAIIIEDN